MSSSSGPRAEPGQPAVNVGEEQSSVGRVEQVHGRPSRRFALLVGLTAGLGAVGCEKKTDEAITVAVERGTAQVRAGRAADAISTLTPIVRRDEAPGATLVAKYTLGHAHRSLADEKARSLVGMYVEIARLTSDIAQIGQALSVGNTLVTGYRLQDPTAVRERIRERIAEAQGGPGRDVWVDTGRDPVLTLSAARQRLSAVQEQVAARQAQRQALLDRRRAAVAEADELRSRVDGLTGRAAVDAFTLASNARKQVSVVSGEIDQVEAQLAVLRQQQAVAEGQVAVVERYIAGLQAQERAVTTAYEQLTSRIGGQLAVSRSAVEGAAEGATSLQAKAAELAGTVATADELLAEVEKLLNEAAVAYEAAFIEAGRLRAELTTRIGPAGSTSQFDATVLDALRRTVWPTVYRHQKGLALASLGDLQAQRAAVMHQLARTADSVKVAVEAAGLTVPEGLRRDFSAQARTALESATAAYRRADEELLGAAEGLQGTDAETRQRRLSSTAGRMWVHYNWGKMLQLVGDTAESQRRITEAIALRDQLVSDGFVLPSLPGELALAAATPPPTNN